MQSNERGNRNFIVWILKKSYRINVRHLSRKIHHFTCNKWISKNQHNHSLHHHRSDSPTFLLALLVRQGNFFLLEVRVGMILAIPLYRPSTDSAHETCVCMCTDNLQEKYYCSNRIFSITSYISYKIWQGKDIIGVVRRSVTMPLIHEYINK